MATKVVGLDFGSRSVKLCESAATLRATDIVGYDYEELTLEPEQRPAYDQLAEAAQRLLIRKGLMDETILCSPPAHIVSFLELTLPFDSSNKSRTLSSIFPYFKNSLSLINSIQDNFCGNPIISDSLLSSRIKYR